MTRPFTILPPPGELDAAPEIPPLEDSGEGWGSVVATSIETWRPPHLRPEEQQEGQ